MEIESGSLVKIKPGVSWRGWDLSNKEGIVVSTESYITVLVEEIQTEVKLFRSEIAKHITEKEFLPDLFSEEDW